MLRIQKNGANYKIKLGCGREALNGRLFLLSDSRWNYKLNMSVPPDWFGFCVVTAEDGTSKTRAIFTTFKKQKSQTCPIVISKLYGYKNKKKKK